MMDEFIGLRKCCRNMNFGSELGRGMNGESCLAGKGVFIRCVRYDISYCFKSRKSKS